MSKTKSSVSYDDKKRLARQIQSIKDVQKLIEIVNIIREHNQDLVISENDNGIFLKFNDLSQSTYPAVKTIIKEILKKSTPVSSTTESSTNVSQNKDDVDNLVKYKYNNCEKNLLKKQKYNEAIAKNNSS